MNKQVLQQKIEQLHSLLGKIQQDYSPAALANSFGAEDMVLTDMIARHYPKISIFTLDTGRLPQETYDLMQKVKQRYDVTVRAYFPDATTIEDYVAQYGPNGFYNSVDLRKRCCYIRKVEPLKRALAEKRAWITGMRREQSTTREELEVSVFDTIHGIHKFNPLYNWTEKEVWDYIKQHDVPYNALHDRFYPSIGCAPCTRAITPGEDIRSGRWWWENPDSKECGLHTQK
jgi:phosphoadenosine phosphosulfate reductase